MIKRVLLVCSLMVAAGLTWYFFFRETPTDRIEALEARLRDNSEQAPNREQRREIYEQIRKEYDQLSPAQRRTMALEREKDSWFQKDIDAYYALPVEQRPAYLDKRIDDMMAMRERWMAQREGGSGDGGGREGGRGDRGGPGGWGGGGFRTPEERNARRREMLDNSSPEGRARRHGYFQDLRARMNERGMGFGR
ncbi:MAG: hypothetical protein K1X74_10615 [Pirellulales bacterium]|nr:hypothetical protein [Pirellulales bacterium]